MHPQLRICHERIASDPQVHDKRKPEQFQWCSLHDVRWCLDCGYYACSVHIASRHDGHLVEPD